MPRRPLSFWCVAAITAACLGVWGLTAETVIRSAGWTRDLGYSLERRGATLHVFAVVPGGPADGKLKPGDRLVAINGDRRASTGGLAGILDLPRNATYVVQVRRNGVELEYPLPLPFRRFPVPWWGVASCLVSALAGIAMAALLGFAKPGSRTVRYAMAFLLLSACMSLSVALNQAVMQGFRLALFGLLGILGNLSPPAGYQCASVFPVAVQEGRRWKAVKALVWAVGLFCWLLLLPTGLMCTLGAGGALGLYARFYPLADAATALWIRLFPVRGFVLCLAVSAVLVRNYMRFGEAGERRRIRLVVGGTLLSLLPEFVFQAGFAAHKLTGRGIDPGGAAATAEMALAPLATAVLAPLLAYAILKHRVLGIRIVIRKGLRYLFAKHALEALLVLPALVLAVRIATRPHLSVAEAFFGNWWCGVLMAVSGLALRFRRPLLAALDRRFFREAYNQERVLMDLIGHIRSCAWSPSLEQSVCGRIEGALHPQGVAMLRRAPGSGETAPGFALGPARDLRLPAGGALLRWLEGCARAQEVSNARDLSDADKSRLREAGIELVVPVRGSAGGGLGALLLGPKKSEEPYAASDRELLEAIAGELGIVYENLCLKESVDREKQTRLQVLAHVTQAGIDLLRECPTCGTCYEASVQRCPADGHELALTLPVERVLDGKYRLDQRIGAGGMGAVYRAWDLRLGRPIAVKIMVGALFGNRAAQHRFEREARTAARLNHPNIVAVYDFDLLGGGAYLVMELIQGQNLRAELDTAGPLSPVQAAAWFDQLLAGLAAAHQAGVVHRDLKPANILIARPQAGAEEIKIADFGLARLKTAEAADGPTLTLSGTVLGTLGYMSPEQLLGQEADERSDLFSVGVLVAEALTGRKPFAGRTPQELLAALDRTVPSLAGDGPDIARLNSIVAACLSSDPARRPGSAAQLRAELIPILRSCPPLRPIAQAAAAPTGGNTETEGPRRR